MATPLSETVNIYHNYLCVLFNLFFSFSLTVEQLLSCDSPKKRKEYLFLVCGQKVPLPKGKTEDDDDDSGSETNKTVSPPTSVYLIHIQVSSRDVLNFFLKIFFIKYDFGHKAPGIDLCFYPVTKHLFINWL